MSLLMPGNSGEYSSSSEYLKEYGGLIIDISTLIDTLDYSAPKKFDERNFMVERIESPLQVPQQVSDQIGKVTSARVTYEVSDEDPAIRVELYGDARCYLISRTTSTQALVDTVLDISPVDPFSATLLGLNQNPAADSINKEYSDEFEKRVHNLEGISNAEFVRLLLHLAQPELELDDSEMVTKKLESTNPLTPEIMQDFIDSSSITAQFENSVFQYPFLNDTSAELFFSQENDQPSSFAFACVDPVGETLEFRGTIHKSLELEFPQQAIAKGINSDAIDTVLSFPLTLSEIKYIRTIIQEEIQSIPQQNNIEEVLTSAIDTIPQLDDTTQKALIDREVDSQIERHAIEKIELYETLDDEMAHLIDEQDEDNT